MTMNKNPYEHLSRINDPRFEGGETLYCNGLGGLNKVEVTEPILKAKLSSPSGIRGNNVLIQLREVFKDYPDGPWYVDCINGIIYIHNSNFSDIPTDTYVFKDEPGEVLSVNISLQNKHRPKKNKKVNLYDDLNDYRTSLDMDLANLYGDPNRSTFFNEANNQVDWTDPNTLITSYEGLKNGFANTWYKSYIANVAEGEARVKANEKTLEELQTSPGLAKYGEQDLIRMMKQNPQMIAAFKEGIKKATLNNYRIEDGVWYLRVGNTPETILRTSDITNGATMDQMISGQTYNVPWANFKINKTGWDYRRMVQQNAIKTFHSGEAKEESMGTQGMNKLAALGTRSEGYQSSYFWEMSAAGQLGDQSLIRRDRIPYILAAAGDPEAIQIVNKQTMIKSIEDYMKNLMKKAQEKELTCNMVVVGKPSLGCSKNLNVFNLGEHYSGVWYVKTVTHSLTPSQGYTTTLDMTFRKKLKPSKQ